jgi:hypothetical protein
MDPALTVALVIAAFSAVSAFVGYWSGRSRGEQNMTIVIRRYEAAQEINVDLAQHIAHMRKHLGTLTPDELAAFDAITTNLRKDAA